MLVSNELGGNFFFFLKNPISQTDKKLIYPFSLYNHVCDYGCTYVYTNTLDLNSESHLLVFIVKQQNPPNLEPSPLLPGILPKSGNRTSAWLTQHFPVVRYLEHFRFLALIK